LERDANITLFYLLEYSTAKVEIIKKIGRNVIIEKQEIAQK